MMTARMLALFMGALFAGAEGAAARSALEVGFEEADADRDGRVSIAEMERQQQKRFQERDLNLDGQIELFEFRRPEPPGLSEEGRRQWSASRAMQFEALDRDKNGRMSFDEFANTARLAFVFGDQDKDQFLTWAELQTYVERGAEAMAQRAAQTQARSLDTDGDGRLTRFEFVNARSAAMTAQDANRDGDLVFEEFAPQAPRLPADAVAILRRTFSEIDENGDGRIDPFEHRRKSEDLFDRMDADGDGQISPSEFNPG